MSKIFSEILGVRISNVSNYDQVYQTLKLFYVSSTSYITVNNVHTVVEGVLNDKYKNIINNSLLALPDGKPLSLIARLKGEKNISRIFGPTFFEKTLELGQKDGLKHYLFGSSSETLKKMVNVIKERFPSAIISGSYSPPFSDFTSAENERYIEQMNKSEADIFWIGLGAPKQEIWMYENYNKLNKGIMIGIGAGFDYLAGNIKHAPMWMKNMSLEWLFRLLQEPRRLWKRYLVTNTLFMYFLILDYLGVKKFD